MVDGTYNGAMGTYTCSGTANCTATVNAMGMLTALSDGWIFTPAMGATSDQPDYDYLSYGFWLKRTTDKDGVLTYNEVETFAGSSGATFGQVQVSDTDTDGTIPASMLNSITGAIDKFVLSGGEANVWSVELSGDIDATDGTFSGMAKGGVGDGSHQRDFPWPRHCCDRDGHSGRRMTACIRAARSANSTPGSPTARWPAPSERGWISKVSGLSKVRT